MLLFWWIPISPAATLKLSVVFSYWLYDRTPEWNCPPPDRGMFGLQNRRSDDLRIIKYGSSLLKLIISVKALRYDDSYVDFKTHLNNKASPWADFSMWYASISEFITITQQKSHWLHVVKFSRIDYLLSNHLSNGGRILLNFKGLPNSTLSSSAYDFQITATMSII